MLELPKYFKNLHLAISCICGTPRIVNIDFSKTNCSDKYKNIPIDEWESCLLGYFAHFKENKSQMMIGGDNWEFYIGGNAKTKEDLIKILQQRIEEIQKISECEAKMIKVTDDLKIMTNRAIVSIKDEDKESFTNSIKYILEQLEYKEYDVFIEYLFNKIISEVKND